ncbi:hypothetical protein ZIOFF_036579 [Zingiber officinale]|uniref:Reverse transcriptase Ty1/copia-type domain-containing protein n=1 Tax=Zingiber officinale TaxID=94328 RepID=A0A8J5KYR1_ZINOF|nr:hypothetical protein ZIOFF_036579 [Zingiber officinale]
MFGEFKEAMTKEFEMTDIGLMAYYLGIEVNQREDESFISQAGYAREILKKFRMDNSKSINTPVECGVKLSKHDKEEKVDPTFFKSLVGSLRYLTCTRPDILYVVGLVSRYMEDPTTTHLKIAKRILRYIKGRRWSSALGQRGRGKNLFVNAAPCGSVGCGQPVWHNETTLLGHKRGKAAPVDFERCSSAGEEKTSGVR